MENKKTKLKEIKSWEIEKKNGHDYYVYVNGVLIDIWADFWGRWDYGRFIEILNRQNYDLSNINDNDVFEFIMLFGSKSMMI